MARNRRSSGKKRTKKSKGSVIGKIFKWLVLLVIIGAIFGGGGVAGLFYYYGQDLPQLLEREDYQPEQVSRVYASGGELIGEFISQDGRRTVLAMDEIPDHVRYSFMAAEDADFMTHEGIDYVGMIRAFYYAVRYDTGIKGTSTITQQVIKNLMLTPERKIERKIKEIILARELEKNLTKEDILYLYLNTIYLGHGNYGVEEAARYYFGKSARDLEIEEAAILAGITQSPETLSPKKHPEKALKRRSYVLRQLWEKGFIEEATYRKADDAELVTKRYDTSYPNLDTTPFFVEHVRKMLVDKYGAEKVYTGGLRVHTTVELDQQTIAKGSLREGLRVYDARREFYRPVRQLDAKEIDAFIEKQAKKLAKSALQTGKVYEAVVVSVDPNKELVTLSLGDVPARLILKPRTRILGDGDDQKKVDEIFERGHVLEVIPQAVEPDDEGSVPVGFRPGPNSALVSIDPKTRDVIAMVGGYSFEENEYDHATQARRQTGSTFKPFVYGAALESKRITPATIYLDSPAVFKMHGGKSWSPKNSDGSWRGAIRVREGLGASRNVVAVRVLRDIGIEKATEFAKRLGVKSTIVQNFTMVMGSSELTPLEITNAYATLASGGIYAEPRFITRVETANGESDTFETRFERVLAPEVAFIISDLMTSVTMGYVDSNGTRRGGTAGALRRGFDREFAGKTGTTNESRDAWFIGFTPQHVAGAWVGFDNNKPLGRREYGGRVAGPIWRDYMKLAHEDLDEKKFEAPSSGITTATIDPATGKLARLEGIEEVFLSGTAPTTYAPIDQDSGEDDFLMNQFGTSEDPEDKDDTTTD
jgi:penicillin-binding protein 1A